jgi:hypothetical protein
LAIQYARNRLAIRLKGCDDKSLDAIVGSRRN